MSISLKNPVTLSILLFMAFQLSAQKSSERGSVLADYDQLEIPIGYRKHLHWDLPLPVKGESGSEISWTSGNTEYISNEGRILKRAPREGKPVVVRMTATIQSGKIKKKKNFDVTIAREDPAFDGYLFSYFEGSGDRQKQEQLRFGVSTDVVNWSALNDNEPIIPSSEISATGGIRDPHILRGEDQSSFFMVATDMFTVKNGWDHNPGIILMKSENLTNWNHGIIDLEKEYPEKFAGVKWVWAPQTIYDPLVDKYMVYFTVRFYNDQYLEFYCAYANDDFTAFENEPTLMFRTKYGAIDGDIIYKEGLYHLFYKGNTKDENGHEFENGIEQATSTSLQGPWEEKFEYIDVYAGTNTHVEGSSIFKLNNKEEYILMYDLYSSHRYEFQRSTDLFHFTEKSETFTKNFNPRHGTVISITAEEAQRLQDKWGGVPEVLLKSDNQ